MLNEVIVCLGSNTRQEEKMEQAVGMLSERFPSAVYSAAEFTEPIDCLPFSLFLNRVALLRTPLSIDELTTLFKQIEYTLGRRAEHKSQGIVVIDIDLLRWNDRILKPEDMKRGYVVSGLRSLFPAGEYDEGSGEEPQLSGGGNQAVDRPAE